MSDLSYTHEEADTRLLFHASPSFHHVYTKLLIHVRPVLHSRRSGHTAPVPCLPFVPSCIYQAVDTCQTCPTHEEADTRFLFQASPSFHHVFTKLMIHVRPVLHSRRSGHTAPVPCLPFVPSCIYQAVDTCQTCPTLTKKRTHGSCSKPPLRSIMYLPSWWYMSDLSYTHEEADTRFLFQASHSFHHVYTKLLIHVRPVLHSRRSGHTAPVSCLPFVPSCIYQAVDTCQTCPTLTKKRTHGSCSKPPLRSIMYLPSWWYMSDLSYTHEEADTRFLFQASHSFHHVYTKLMIHARPVLHTRRSGYVVPVPCLPFVPSCIYQAVDTCQTCPTLTKKRTHGSCSKPPIRSIMYIPSWWYMQHNLLYWCGDSRNCCVKCVTGLWNIGSIWSWFQATLHTVT